MKAHLDRTTSTTLIGAILAGAVVLPMIPLGPLSLRLSDLVALIPIPLFIGLAFSFPRFKLFWWYVLYVVAAVLSLAYGYLVLDVPRTPRDVNEIGRLAIPLFVMWATLGSHKRDARRIIEAVLFWGAVFVVVFGFIQYFAPHVIPVGVLRAWGGSAHIRVLLTRVPPRVFSTGANPNLGAAIALFFMFFHAFSFWYRRKLKNLSMAILLLTIVALTASRTAAIALVFSSMVVVLFSRQFSRNQRMLLIVLVAASIAMIWFQVDYIRLGITQLIEGRSFSWGARIERFVDAIALFRESPAFGWGPAKALHTTISDGEYFMNLRRYGAFGIFAFSMFFFGSIVYLLRFVRRFGRELETRDRVIVLTALAFTLTGSIVMITNVFVTSYQLVVPYVLLLAYAELCRNEVRRAPDVALD